MNLIQTALLMLVVILAYPLGLLLAKSTKEELKQRRRAFTSIILASISVVFVSLFLRLSGEEKIFLATGMIFVSIISYVSFKESYAREKLKAIKNKIKTRKRKK